MPWHAEGPITGSRRAEVVAAVATSVKACIRVRGAACARAGWDSYVYEYAATKGIPMEDCAVYTARDNWQCGLMQQCYMCSGAGNHTCRPVVRCAHGTEHRHPLSHACSPPSLLSGVGCIMTSSHACIFGAMAGLGTALPAD